MIEITEQQYVNMDENSGGFCLTCEAEAYGVEPDARKYPCEACGENSVYGVAELLMMGALTFVLDFRKPEKGNNYDTKARYYRP